MDDGFETSIEQVFAELCRDPEVIALHRQLKAAFEAEARQGRIGWTWRTPASTSQETSHGQR